MLEGCIAFKQHSSCIIGTTAGFSDVFAVIFAPNPASEIVFDSNSERVRFQQLEHVVKLFILHQLFVSDFDQQPITDKVASAISQDWEYFRRCIRKRNRP